MANLALIRKAAELAKQDPLAAYNMLHVGGERTSQVAELTRMLDDVEGNLNDAIHTLGQASRKARQLKISGPFSGQIDSYILPHLKQWIESTHQPGSLISLRDILADEDFSERTATYQRRALDEMPPVMGPAERSAMAMFLREVYEGNKGLMRAALTDDYGESFSALSRIVGAMRKALHKVPRFPTDILAILAKLEADLLDVSVAGVSQALEGRSQHSMEYAAREILESIKFMHMSQGDGDMLGTLRIMATMLDDVARALLHVEKSPPTLVTRLKGVAVKIHNQTTEQAELAPATAL
jgi:hypothetical protein